MPSTETPTESTEQSPASLFTPGGPLLRIYVEQFPNRDVRKLHLSIPVSDRRFHKYDKNIPDHVVDLSARLDDLPAVADDRLFNDVFRKSIHITINKAFGWDDCIAQVLDVLTAFYIEHHGICGIEVEEGPRPLSFDRALSAGVEAPPSA